MIYQLRDDIFFDFEEGILYGYPPDPGPNKKPKNPKAKKELPLTGQCLQLFRCLVEYGGNPVPFNRLKAAINNNRNNSVYEVFNNLYHQIDYIFDPFGENDFHEKVIGKDGRNKGYYVAFIGPWSPPASNEPDEKGESSEKEDTPLSDKSNKNISVIGDNAFSDRSITSVVVPEGVESIRERAFFDCRNLVKITLPSTLRRIATDAFFNCSSLTSIVIPDGVEAIENRAFGDCSNLKNLSLPSALRRIGTRAFLGTALTSVIIPEGVETIENATFCECRNLVKITLPSTLRKIGADAFSYCSALKSIVIPDGCKEIGEHCFTGCENLKDISVPASVYAIAVDAFYTGCNEVVIHTAKGTVAERMAKYWCWKIDYSSATLRE